MITLQNKKQEPDRYMQNLKVKPLKINLESQKFAALEQPD